MSVVRPFPAQVVRQECAADNVTQMLDALPATERPAVLEAHRSPRRGVVRDAYVESGAAFYVYRLRRGDDEHVGVVGEVRTEAFLDGHVRGHEAVQPDRVAGLVEHFTSAAVRSELVALLHRSGPDVVAATKQTLVSDPVLRFTGPDSWEQTVWRVPDAAASVLSEGLSLGVHYIADGHHRVAASLAVWERNGRPRDAGVMCVMYPLDGLRLLAFHRRVAGPVRKDDLWALLSEDFELREVGRPEEATGCCGLYLDRRWYDVSHTRSRPPGVAGLDVAILDDQVLSPLLGTDAHSTSRLEIVSALSGVDALTQACDEDGGALFTLRPPTLEQLTDVADRGEVMPPKTTYFDPKPYAGIFLR